MIYENIKVEPAGSYLADPKEIKTPKPATEVKLAEKGLKSGDLISLLSMGDYQAGETGFKDIDKGLLAVFIDKSGNYLQPQKFRPVFTDPQSSGAKTDIAQDFRVGQDLFPVTFTKIGRAHV